MKPRLLSRAWIFVSHSTKDISKVRLVRNRLERAGAEPLIFRLKFLDDRPFSIATLLHAEIKARQFFLFCRSANSLSSPWVREEVAYVDSFSGKSKYVIDLDSAPWPIPVAKIESFLKNAFIVFGYAWTDRRLVNPLIDELKRSGVGERDYERIADDPSYVETIEGKFAEPLTIDYGIRGLDDRPRSDGQTWVTAAIAARESAEIFVVAASQAFRQTLLDELSAEELANIRRAYRSAYVLTPDGVPGEGDMWGRLRRAEWTVLTGSVDQQLRQLVQELKDTAAVDVHSSGAAITK